MVYAHCWCNHYFTIDKLKLYKTLKDSSMAPTYKQFFMMMVLLVSLLLTSEGQDIANSPSPYECTGTPCEKILHEDCDLYCIFKGYATGNCLNKGQPRRECCCMKHYTV